MMISKVAFIAGLVMQIVIRYPYRNNTKKSYSDRQELGLLILLTLGSGVFPFIYILTNWLSFADYDAPIWVIGIGIVVMIAGLWLFWRAHTDLGRNWSSTLEIYDQHTLITQGIYQRIRHPMYASNWLMVIAQALLLSNWIAGLGGIVGFGLMYFLRVGKEEQMMLQQFGEQYQQYMAKTGRVIPKGSASV